MQDEDKAQIQYHHKIVEKGYENQTYFARVLEVATQTVKHFQYVLHRFDKYISYDLNPKTLDLSKGNLASAHNDMGNFEIQTESEHNRLNIISARHIFESVNSCNNIIANFLHYFFKLNETCRLLSTSSLDLNLLFSFHTTVSEFKQEEGQ